MKTKEFKINTINKGHIIRLVHYALVADNPRQDAYDEHLVPCQDLERGFDFSIRGTKLVESVDSADSYTTTKKVTKTQLVEVFEGVRDNVFTVEFVKADKKLRKLRGYMVQKETGMGRSMCIDLDIPKDEKSYDNRLRQVDHRTIKKLIVDGVCYEVK